MKSSLYTSRLVYFSPLGGGPKGAGEAADASPNALYDRADKAIARLNSMGDTAGASKIQKLVQDHKELKSTPGYNMHDSIEDANIISKRLDRVDRKIALAAKPDEDIYAKIDEAPGQAQDKGKSAIDNAANNPLFAPEAQNPDDEKQGAEYAGIAMEVPGPDPMGGAIENKEKEPELKQVTPTNEEKDYAINELERKGQVTVGVHNVNIDGGGYYEVNVSDSNDSGQNTYVVRKWAPKEK